MVWSRSVVFLLLWAVLLIAGAADALVIRRLPVDLGGPPSTRGVAWGTGALLIADTRAQAIMVLGADGLARRIGCGVRGRAGGPANIARLNGPTDATEGGDGNLYWTEPIGRLVRRWNRAGNRVEDVASLGPLAYPEGISADASRVYVADAGQSRIWSLRTPCEAPCAVVAVAGSETPGFAGDGGSALLARLSGPRDVAVWGGDLYIADTGNARIRRVHDGMIATVAGSGYGSSGDGGQATAAKFKQPWSIAFSPAGELWIADAQDNRLRRVGVDGVVATMAGTGTAQPAWTLPAIAPEDVGFDPRAVPLTEPRAIAVASDGTVYVGSETDAVLYALSESLPTVTPAQSATATIARTWTSVPTYTPPATYTGLATYTPPPTFTPPATFTPRETYTVQPTATETVTRTAAPSETVTKTPTVAQIRVCDVTGDGTVSVLDAVRILRYVAGLDPCACTACTPTPGG